MMSVKALQHLILISESWTFFGRIRRAPSTVLEGAVEVLCGVMVKREHHAVTVVSSSVEAIALDEVQHGHGEGPSLHAIRTGTTTVVTDARTDMRWPKYSKAVRDQGYHLMGYAPCSAARSPGHSSTSMPANQTPLPHRF